MRKMAMILALLGFLSFSGVTFAGEQISTASAVKVEVEKQVDLTVPTKEKGSLEVLLDSQKITGFVPLNFMKIAIRKAVSEGVSPNTIVVLFLFPLVAALVAFSRQVVGVSGFGIIIPAMLSMAFLSTGAVAGLVLLGFIVVVATGVRMMLKKIQVPYTPKLAMLIWFVSMAVMALLVVSPLLGLERLVNVGIFPILLFVMLAESFVEAQITRTVKTAFLMTLETVILALIAYGVMGARVVQSQVLLNPEVSVVVILAMDYLIGKYQGLRLMEAWRFRKMWKK